MNHGNDKLNVNDIKFSLKNFYTYVYSKWLHARSCFMHKTKIFLLICYTFKEARLFILFSNCILLVDFGIFSILFLYTGAL